MRIIPKIFSFDENDVPPELRAQRTLNKSRIPEMVRYLLEIQKIMCSLRLQHPLPLTSSLMSTQVQTTWERYAYRWMRKF